ncbi:MAG: glycosyltransferase [Xanthomonadales bacterium]|nr:glycosyltransferase [Xanthomonadales bacterium]
MMHSGSARPRIAILVPCYNEGVTIGKVVRDFKAALPAAAVHVYDNNSRDDSIAAAIEAGALVRSVACQGKGNVVRRLFADVEADIYVLVDGDDTYDAASAPAMIEALRSSGADTVVGVRRPLDSKLAWRPGHAFGNRMLTGFLGVLFGRPCRDILSGYRVFTRRFVKSFPVLSAGFEIETELTVHALELRMAVAEVETPYGERPEGSVSKLNTIRDGVRILATIIRLFSAERPLVFYGVTAAVLLALALVLALPIVVTYTQTGLVPRFPTAILATGIALLSALSFFSGLILDTVTRGRRELKMLAYLGTGSRPGD